MFEDSTSGWDGVIGRFTLLTETAKNQQSKWNNSSQDFAHQARMGTRSWWTEGEPKKTGSFLEVGRWNWECMHTHSHRDRDTDRGTHRQTSPEICRESHSSIQLSTVQRTHMRKLPTAGRNYQKGLERTVPRAHKEPEVVPVYVTPCSIEQWLQYKAGSPLSSVDKLALHFSSLVYESLKQDLKGWNSFQITLPQHTTKVKNIFWSTKVTQYP